MKTICFRPSFMLSVFTYFSMVTFSALAAAQIPQDQENNSVNLKVMSFNIRYGNANDGKNRWKNRKDLVADTIIRFRPDFLGTQETLPFQAKFLKGKLEGYQYIGWSREKNPQGEQCGIFYKTSRFKKVRDGQFWLSKTPNKKFSKDWDSSLPRVATWAVLKDQKSSTEILFVNTHFDHRGKVAREKSASLVLNWIQKNHPRLPVVVTGDFNAGPNSTCYQNLMKNDLLSDTYRKIHPKQKSNEGTFNGFRGTQSGARIDWILTSRQFLVHSANIDNYSKENRYPSDHFPVTATISMISKESKSK